MGVVNPMIIPEAGQPLHPPVFSPPVDFEANRSYTAGNAGSHARHQVSSGLVYYIIRQSAGGSFQWRRRGGEG